jgi:hypothetical protein
MRAKSTYAPLVTQAPYADAQVVGPPATVPNYRSRFNMASGAYPCYRWLILNSDAGYVGKPAVA